MNFDNKAENLTQVIAIKFKMKQNHAINDGSDWRSFRGERCKMGKLNLPIVEYVYVLWNCKKTRLLLA